MAQSVRSRPIWPVTMATVKRLTKGQARDSMSKSRATPMQSPFLDQSIVTDDDNTVDQSGTLEQLVELIELGVRAKKEAERQKAIYDSIRDQVCAMLRDLGQDKIETSVGKARLKETKSGWQFSSATNQLGEQFKLQQEIEKRSGTAKPVKITLSADLFPS